MFKLPVIRHAVNRHAFPDPNHVLYQLIFSPLYILKKPLYLLKKLQASDLCIC